SNQQPRRCLAVGAEPMFSTRLPYIFNLCSDPFERAKDDATMFYDKWLADHVFLLVPTQVLIGQYLKTFEEFPPRQKPASFSINQALEKARESHAALEKGSAGR